jgi:hypothetical protein
MSTSAVSSSTPSYQPPPSNGMQNNFQALTQAIQSGNLSAAQQAYATLTQNAPQGSGNGNNPFAQAIANIGSALQSGDIGGAQSALQSMQANVKGHHHRHAPPSQDSSNTTPPSNANATSSTSSTSSNAVDVSA